MFIDAELHFSPTVFIKLMFGMDKEMFRLMSSAQSQQQEAQKWPKFVDLSFKFDNQNILLSFKEFKDVYQVHFTQLGKFGQVIEIIHPRHSSEQVPGTYQPIEYETKQLLGPDSPESDLFLRRLVGVLKATNRCRKPTIVFLGIDGFNQTLFQTALDKIEECLRL
jgi:hypothetical protein